MLQRVRWLATALCVAVAILAGPGASAQEADAPVLLILDASGSMNATDDAGVRLIDGAQQALTRLVEILPEGAPVGLRVYGHRVPNTDKANGCLDTELIVPVGPLDRQSMIEAIGGFSAKGFTPIGLSLEQAASDLPDGRGTIILLSDGEDTCAPPDPCEVAAGLLEAGIDVRVHTVGFFLGEDDPAREQLKCIADTTGASYRDVDAIDSLTAELGQLVMESLPGIGHIDLPVIGSLVRTSAPVLNLGAPSGNAPPGSGNGAYITNLPPGETVWFAVELNAPSFLGVGGGITSIVGDAQPGDTLSVVITNEAGAEVQLWDSRWGQSRLELADDDFGPGFGASTGIGFDGLWSGMSTEERPSIEFFGYAEESHDAAVRELARRPEPPPAGPGIYYFGFTWTAEAQSSARQLDFRVSTWPMTDSTHLQYRTVEGAEEAASAPQLRPTQYVRGPLPPGPGDGWLQGGYVATIERGTTLWYSVSVEWDEGLSVRAFLNRPEGATATAGETFGVELFDPGMQPVTWPFEDRESTVDLTDPGALDASFLPRGLAPRPLAGGAAPLVVGEGPTIDGIYHMAFTWEGPADGTTAEIEFIVNLHGDLPGAVEIFATPPDTLPLDTAPPADSPGEEAAPADEETGASDVLTFIALVVLVLGGGGWLLLRRRRRA